MMAELVALPSISCADPELDTSNQAVIERLAGWLDDMGFACDIQQLPNWPGKYNLVATLGDVGAGAPAALALCGHSDTVPFDADLWDTDPFKLSEREGKLYGLGSCDMKGFLALAVEASKQTLRRDLRRALCLVATADEESGMDGARAMLDNGHAPAEVAVVGEPTGLQPIRSHKGILMEAFRIGGHAGHSSNPALGLNAIEGGYRVMTELLALRDELIKGDSNKHFKVGYSTLNLGHIEGGDSPNRIPPDCELHVDLRFLPGQELEDMRATLRERARKALADTDYALECRPLFAGSPAFDTPADADIVRTCEAISGRRAGAVDFATEGAFFNRLGMDSVIMGPGYIDHAHQANEHLALEFVQPTLDRLGSLIHHYCL